MHTGQLKDNLLFSKKEQDVPTTKQGKKGKRKERTTDHRTTHKWQTMKKCRGGFSNLMRMRKKPGSNNWSDSLPHTLAHTLTMMDWVSSMN